MNNPKVVARIPKVHAAKHNRVAALMLQWNSCTERDSWLKENQAVVFKKFTENILESTRRLNCHNACGADAHKHYLATVAGYITTRKEVKLLK